MVYLITYDLKKPGQNYNELYEAIKSLGSWWHYLESTWLVDTSLIAPRISEKLNPKIDKNDRLLVIKVTSDYSGWLTNDAWDWIKQHITNY